MRHLTYFRGSVEVRPPLNPAACRNRRRRTCKLDSVVCLPANSSQAILHQRFHIRHQCGVRRSPGSIPAQLDQCDGMAGMMELDGRPVTPDELAGLGLYNYGHFTTMRVDHGRVRGLSLHIRRLVNDCRTLFDTDIDPETIRKLVERSSAHSSVVVRVTVFAPGLELDRLGWPVQPHILVTTRPAADHELPPLRLRSIRYQRELPQVKHVSLFGSIYHRRRAQLDGFDDAVFVDGRSRICEGPTWNIAFVDGDRLVWPEAECLPGVTMALLKALGQPELTIAEVDLRSIGAMRAAFVTNAAVGVRPVQLIDHSHYDPDSDLIRDLRNTYLAIPGENL
jgi:branched-subunit amino acid aminotransferase/4-amino-4-deoxychorismate lyase